MMKRARGDSERSARRQRALPFTGFNVIGRGKLAFEGAKLPKSSTVYGGSDHAAHHHCIDKCVFSISILVYHTTVRHHSRL